MKTVYKYSVPIADNPVIPLPEGAKVLSVGAQDYEVKLWALVDPDKPMVSRNFRLAGTGHDIEGNNLHFIGTVIMNGLVLHLFEQVEF